MGDVVLATALVESLHQSGVAKNPHVLVRKGNEGVFAGHPFVSKVFAWDKQSASLPHIIANIRGEKYDVVINIQRHFRSGLITVLSGGKQTRGFNKNPLSVMFSKAFQHVIDGRHEIERNHQLIADFANTVSAPPRLYPTEADRCFVAPFQTKPYVCVAPTSVWFTKQYPARQWIELISRMSVPVYLLGAANDRQQCDAIKQACTGVSVTTLAGSLTILQSAALMAGATMNFVNDSAALHIASSVSAPVTAVFCSTVPRFGFGPIGPKGTIVETSEVLQCRPCGIHGRASCPEGHFRCATSITTQQILATAATVESN